MTEKTIIECDGKHSGEPPAEPHETNGAVPPDWGLFIDGEGTERHLCPECAFRTMRWTCAGVSDGDAFDRVQHNYTDIDELPDSVNASGETQSMSLMKVIDEPPLDFPEFGPPLGSDEQDTEAYGFHVFDHLHVYVIGAHKDEPHVVVDSDEFTTTLEVWDSENSFDRIDLGPGVEINAA